MSLAAFVCCLFTLSVSGMFTWDVMKAALALGRYRTIAGGPRIVAALVTLAGLIVMAFAAMAASTYQR